LSTEITNNSNPHFSNILGGRLRQIVTGGAPTSPKVIQFMQKCFGCMVSVSYGTSEAGAIANDNQIVSDVQVKLIDCPEYGYTTKVFIWFCFLQFSSKKFFALQKK
jgi:acyl-CoA synthetase (AMP-forming)/AMP-acid ligase II